MEFVRQEYCSGLPLSSPGYLPNSGIKPGSPALQVDSLPSEAPINNTHTHTHTHTHNVYFSIRKIKIEEVIKNQTSVMTALTHILQPENPHPLYTSPMTNQG